MGETRMSEGFNAGNFQDLSQLGAMLQRKQALADQQRQTAALQQSLRELQAAQSQQVEIEKQRLRLEELRMEQAEEERLMKQEEARRMKSIRNFLADSISAFDALKKHHPPRQLDNR